MTMEKSPGGQAGARSNIYGYLCKLNSLPTSHPEFFYFRPDFPVTGALVDAIAEHPGPWTIMLDDIGCGPDAFHPEMMNKLLAVCNRIVGVPADAGLPEQAWDWRRVIVIKTEHHDEWRAALSQLLNKIDRAWEDISPTEAANPKIH